MKRKDLTGQEFGEWKVLERVPNTMPTKWLCRCSCGDTYEVIGTGLSNKSSTRCKKCSLSKIAKDRLTLKPGDVFGKWTVNEYVGNSKWLCECSCGTLLGISSYDLRRKKTQGCNQCGITAFKDLTGTSLYQWTFINFIGNGKWLCECSCGNICEVVSKDIKSGKSTQCVKCSGIISNSENDVADYIKDYFDGDIIRNDRTIINPLEVDIYIPEKNIAIEYNGIYWHSEKYKSNTYHRDKTKACNDKGIHLIHIFEDDWNIHKLRTKKWLLGILNINNPEIVYGRKCKVVEVSPKDVNYLFDINHIQGYNVNNSKAIALYYNGNIISACMFRKEGEGWNLTRYVNIDGYSIIGGFSKMLKMFRLLYDGFIVSFADLSWVNRNNNVYERNGFVVDKIIPPDYKYVVDNHREHKFGYRHKSLERKLKVYNQNLSEHQNCYNNNIYRIYDCGKIKYILN